MASMTCQILVLFVMYSKVLSESALCYVFTISGLQFNREHQQSYVQLYQPYVITAIILNACLGAICASLCMILHCRLLVFAALRALLMVQVEPCR